MEGRCRYRCRCPVVQRRDLHRRKKTAAGPGKTTVAETVPFEAAETAPGTAAETAPGTAAPVEAAEITQNAWVLLEEARVILRPGRELYILAREVDQQRMLANVFLADCLMPANTPRPTEHD